MKEGDQVQVGGMGPIMSIVEIRHNTPMGTVAECVWFDSHRIEQRKSYKIGALKPYVPEEGRFPEHVNTWED